MFISSITRFLLVLCHLNSIRCIFYFANKFDQLPPSSSGLLQNSQFNFSSFDNLNNLFPPNIRVQANVLGTSIDVTLSRIDGLLQTSSIYSDVYIKRDLLSDVTLAEYKDLEFRYYTDPENKMVATVIENTDLNDLGINTYSNDKRITFTTDINGTQIDFQTAIVYDSNTNVQSYEHAYFVRNVYFGNDLLNDQNDNVELENPCMPNPCNQGKCAIGFGLVPACYCPNSYTGAFCQDAITTTTPYCSFCAAQETALNEAKQKAIDSINNSQQLAATAKSEALKALDKLQNAQALATQQAEFDAALVNSSQEFAKAQSNNRIPAEVLRNMAQQLALDTQNARELAKNVTLAIIDAKQQAIISQNAATLSKTSQLAATEAVANYTKLSLCYPNPCKNGGMCTVGSQIKNFTCFCSANYIGPTCENPQGQSLFSNYKGLHNDERIMRINNENHELILERKKRDESPSNNNEIENNLFVEYLIVVDSTVYTLFQNDFGSNLDEPTIMGYIKSFFSQLVNAMNQRYQNSLKNDPNLSLTVSLSNVLILRDPATTPWTNPNIVSVPGNPVSGTAVIKPTAMVNVSTYQFGMALNQMNLSFSFDYAIAVMNLDIWGENPNIPLQKRQGVVGYTAVIGGICTNYSLTIVEFNGFNGIHNGAHEMAHNLGAIHDGDPGAQSCPSEFNNIMTPTSMGSATNLYYFSNCSINAFKARLLSNDFRTVNSGAQCVADVPKTVFSYFKAEVFQEEEVLLGQLYSADQQCRLYIGNYSFYCNGTYSQYGKSKNNDASICDVLYCYNPKTITPNGVCGGGTGVQGLGGIDGTECNGTKSSICYKGKCISSPCAPNPCENGGTCLVTQSMSTKCSCLEKFTGPTCSVRISMPTTTSLPTTTTPPPTTTTPPPTTTTPPPTTTTPPPTTQPPPTTTLEPPTTTTPPPRPPPTTPRITTPLPTFPSVETNSVTTPPQTTPTSTSLFTLPSFQPITTTNQRHVCSRD